MTEAREFHDATQDGSGAGSSPRSEARALRDRAREQQGEHPLHYLPGIDPEFFAFLHERRYGLNRSRKRLRGLIRSGMTIGEIASIMNTKLDGMRAGRKRPGKRLGLAAEVRPETAIAETQRPACEA